MIVQITLTRDELFIINEMLPLWQKYADAFVFMDDNSVDGTYEFLMENKEKSLREMGLQEEMVKFNLVGNI